MKIYRAQTPQYLALSKISAKRAHPREENEKGKITQRFIGDNVLTEVMKTTRENSRKEDTKRIDEMQRVPQLAIPTLSCMVCIRREKDFT